MSSSAKEPEAAATPAPPAESTKKDAPAESTQKGAPPEPKKEPATFTIAVSSKHSLWAVWFLLVYFTLHVLVSVLVPSAKAGMDQMVSATVDTVFGMLIVIVVGSAAYALNDEDRKALGDGVGEFLQAPTSVFPVSLFLFMLYTCAHVLRIPRGENKPYVIGSMENIGWLLFVVTFSQSVSHYVFDIDLLDAIQRFARGIWKGKKDSPDEKPAGEAPPPADGNEVFNLSDNVYDYKDAEAVCSALGARLATYQEVEDAYRRGGEWCNYGWSANQLALFPTQYSTWEKLQASDEEKDHCGRPGINGGKMDAKIKFGANCYGKKPPKPAAPHNHASKGTAAEPAPGAPALTPHQMEVLRRAEYYKQHPQEISAVNGHNGSKWSVY